ncbi:MAG: hypothetical protein GYA47_16645, partial [Desulfovibrio sp.]|nr:hypothetical protein [Desulfovibrio sp.]
QILFSFPHTALPAYVGQQMDVFIETANPDEVQRRHAAGAVAQGGAQ